MPGHPRDGHDPHRLVPGRLLDVVGDVDRDGVAGLEADPPVTRCSPHRDVPGDRSRRLVVLGRRLEQVADLGRIVAVDRARVGAVTGDRHLRVLAARMEVAGREDERRARGRDRPHPRVADLLALLVAGGRGVVWDLVREHVLAVAVEVEALLGVEDRVDLREPGDVHPADSRPHDVGASRGRLRDPVDLPGQVDLPVVGLAEVVEHLVDAPVRGRLHREPIALRHHRDRLLLAGGEGRPAARSEPDDMMEVEVPDRRRDQLAARLDLDHARLEAGDEALGVGAGIEDRGAAGAADDLGVRAGLRDPVVVDVLARVDVDRVGVTRVGRHPRIARGVKDRLARARRGSGDQRQQDDRACGHQRSPPNEALPSHRSALLRIRQQVGPVRPGRGRQADAERLGRPRRRTSARTTASLCSVSLAA